MFHRETDEAKVARNRDAVFDLHATALAWLEPYTGIPYPWGKFDFILIPSFQFGGMEHAGAILYNAAGLLLDESATQNQKLGRASVIAHETAHMWFGDLVTMRWFDDVWMKEVFANFMAAKIVNPSFPEINHELRFLLAHYPAAYEVDRTAGANPIRQKLDNLKDAGSLYGAIIYQKAPIVMRNLETLVGQETFRDGLREYLATYRFANASWPELIAILDRRSPKDVTAWSRAWVDEPGRPTIASLVKPRASGEGVDVEFIASDSRGRGLAWPQALDVRLGDAAGERRLQVELTGTALESRVLLKEPPRYVLPSGGRGYGLFELDEASRRYFLAHLPGVADPVTRGSAWIVLWDEMLEGRVTAAEVIDLALNALPREIDEQNVQRILSYLSGAFWRFVGGPARAALAGRVERTLEEGLERSAGQSLKAAYFNTLVSVATRPETLRRLECLWKKECEIPGLTLAERDFTVLAMELAVREVQGWSTILDAQLARIENPDRKERLAFVMPALSSDPAVRDRFFKRLAVPANRRREPWVLEGVSYLHHPLRATASRPYIRPSLDLLLEIHRTGDIFFPKRWLDATLGGHNSAEVAATVRTFLGEHTDYPAHLRNILLQSADELYRAATLAH
jgi:aminopeptidase N